MLNLTLSLESKPVTPCIKLGCLHQALLKKTLSSTMTQMEIERMKFLIFLLSIVMFFLRSCHTRARYPLPPPPPKRAFNHSIDLVPGSSPPSRTPYRLPKPLIDELQKQITTLAGRGFIEPSKSPFGAPVNFGKKSWWESAPGVWLERTQPDNHEEWSVFTKYGRPLWFNPGK